MIILNEQSIKKLSFPDFDVERMEFSPTEKILNIFVEGAWLKIDGGKELGKGFLFFSEWESLSINSFHPIAETWSLVKEDSTERLKDLCRVQFNDLFVSLAGFGDEEGHWMEWKIVKPKMYAEFEEYIEEL